METSVRVQRMSNSNSDQFLKYHLFELSMYYITFPMYYFAWLITYIILRFRVKQMITTLYNIVLSV